MPFVLYVGLLVFASARALAGVEMAFSIWLLAVLLLFFSFNLLLILLLGNCGLLHALPLLLGAVVIVCLVLLALLLKGRKPSGFSIRSLPLRQTWNKLRQLPLSLGFICLLLSTAAWLIAAAFLLPPRGADDLRYHLPAVFEFVLSGRLSVPPVDRIGYLANPMNADLVLAWPLIFIRDTAVIGLSGFFVLAVSLLAVYCLCRELGLARRYSTLAAMMFFFVPVVLCISGSGYVDLVTATFTTIALVFLLRHGQRPQMVIFYYLTCAALGMLAGMKYGMIVVSIYLFATLLLRGGRAAALRLLSGVLLLLVFGGYWYWRNWIAYGSPLYPSAWDGKSLGIALTADLFRDFGANVTQLSRDVGLGSLHGGLGLTVRAFGLLSVLITTVWASRRGLPWRHLTVFGLLLYATFLTAITSGPNFGWNVRFLIFALPCVCYAMARSISLIHRYRIARQITVGLVLLFSFMGTTVLACSAAISYNIALPLYHRQTGRYVAKSAYVCLSTSRPKSCALWGALDYLSDGNDHPWLVRQFIDPRTDFSAPLYGSHLQNRVEGLSDISPWRAPDAVLFMQLACDGSEARQRTYSAFLQNPAYVRVLRLHDGALFVRKEIAKDGRFQRKLALVLKSLGEAR